MDSTPKISIIIPVYNAEKYLVEAIESVIDQTWSNKELIIIDDSSLDRSYTLAKQYECDWIKVFKLNENRGQSYASNYGFRKATGQLIKYLDADDLINKNYLSNMMLNYKGDDSIYFSHCINFYMDFQNGQQDEYKIEVWDRMLPVDFLIGPMSFMRQGGRWLIPRKIIEKGGLWNESLSLINDFEYFNRLCVNSKLIYYVKNSILYYRQVENSVSSQKSASAFESGFKSIDLASELLLNFENSIRTRQFIANSYQGLLYMIYPRYNYITSQIEKKIETLGGSNKPFDAGGKTLFISKILSWKFALLLRHCILTFKKLLKIKI